MLAFLQIIGGLLLLVGGGDVLVKGAVGLARNLGVSTIVIGLTVVAFGTSAPEAFISAQAAANHPDIAIGNVLGSNIANILLVLGMTAVIAPVVIHPHLARRDGTVMLTVGLLLVGLAFNGMIGLLEGALLLLLIVAYCLYTIRDIRVTGGDPDLVAEMEEETNVHIPTRRALAYCLGGILLLTLGSEVLVDGSVLMAERFGLSEAVIGATIVAVGGSMPELVTSVTAAVRRHGDIGLANIVGSNIFNVTAVIGVATLVAPLSVAGRFKEFDFPVMLLVTVVFFVAMLARKEFGRVAGLAMLASYAAYIGWQYNLIT